MLTTPGPIFLFQFVAHCDRPPALGRRARVSAEAMPSDILAERLGSRIPSSCRVITAHYPPRGTTEKAMAGCLHLDIKIDPAATSRRSHARTFRPAVGEALDLLVQLSSICLVASDGYLKPRLFHLGISAEQRLPLRTTASVSHEKEESDCDHL